MPLRLLTAVLCLVFSGCGPFPQRSQPDLFDEAYSTHRALVARVYWEASRRDFASDKEARDWLAARWSAAETESWKRLSALEQKHLGEGRWNLDTAHRFWRKLAVTADPNVAKEPELDELSID